MATKPHTDKGLEQAVGQEVKEAKQDVQTGNVATVKESAKQPADSLPTGQRRSHPAE